ncbi:MAG: radical SAM protein [Lachnospiraceae bacterium]|nr:radical SAM protein [Lachnospiraceae bacterium]
MLEKLDKNKFNEGYEIMEQNFSIEEHGACRLCPRECGAGRKQGRAGYCGVTGTGVYGARAALHMWEEPCISGEEGSGTVFFSGCPLRCVYCQNYEIAHADRGSEITVERLSDIFIELQDKGANNINLVTPTHYTIEIIQAIAMAKEKGLKLPIVYNCSGYEKVETLRLLEGIVDVYLTDFKYMDSLSAKRYSNASDYPGAAKRALSEMVRQCGQTSFDQKGMMTKGVIVRHLLLPGQIQNGKEVVKYVYETYGDRVFLSLMNQYTPLPHVKDYPEINRRVTEEEYEELVDYAIEIGVENGFIQEGETAEESFIPAFDDEGWN